MKKLLLIPALFCLFISLSVNAQTAPVQPHAEFTDCDNDVLTAKFDAKTSLLTITIETRQDICLSKFQRISVNWDYEVGRFANSDVLFGWMNKNHHHENKNDDAFAGWHGSAKTDTVAYCYGGVSTTLRSVAISTVKGKITFTIPLNAAQVKHLKDARALGNGKNAIVNFITPHVWLKV